MFGRCSLERDALRSAQTIDVRFDEFMMNDMDTVRRVYDLAGQPFDQRAQRSIAAFIAEHPRSRHSTVLFDLDQFSLDAGERSNALDFYTKRFRVPVVT
jgi:hypothetical protein